MKKYLLILTFVFCFLSSMNVNAQEECTTSELNRLKQLANNVEFTYDYELKEYSDDEGVSHVAVYNLTILNDSTDLKYYYRLSDDKDKKEITKEAFSKKEFYPNQKIVITIQAYSENLCSGKTLKTKTISFPSYNYFYYYNEDTCRTYPDFKYCEEFMDTLFLTNEEFLNELEEYKNDLKNDIDDKNNSGEFELKYIILGIVCLLVIVSIIFILVKSKKRDRDL